MSDATGPLSGPRQGAEVVAAQRQFGWLARAGLVARGVVYGVIGVLAIKLAVVTLLDPAA